VGCIDRSRAIKEGRALPTREAKKHMLAEALDRYITDHLTRKRRNKTAAQFESVS